MKRQRSVGITKGRVVLALHAVSQVVVSCGFGM
jgi:hypothetical protein